MELSLKIVLVRCNLSGQRLGLKGNENILVAFLCWAKPCVFVRPTLIHAQACNVSV